ncbi:hypothetical protein FRC02_010826 [Tulasnella sp. 418]|nr:hypothetical protein FRC02_010826 [Tulasnella sp. 418]
MDRCKVHRGPKVEQPIPAPTKLDKVIAGSHRKQLSVTSSVTIHSNYRVLPLKRYKGELNVMLQRVWGTQKFHGASRDCLVNDEKTSSHETSAGRTSSKQPVLVIHGGAGTMSKEGSTPEMREKYREALRSALRAGHAVLEKGGEAMDAAVAAVTYMEDCPYFNAGKGAVFNVAGKNELETSLMLSKPPSTHRDIPKSRRGLTITLITRLKNPAKAVRAIYLSPEAAPHASLSGSVAEDIATSLGQEAVDPSYYFTERRWREHRRGLGLPELPLPPGQGDSWDGDVSLDMMPTGTVGAVCLDSHGCIASVTSTGGKTNKLVGRIGDTPTFAAGFWAEEWEEQGWRRKWKRLMGRSVKRSMGISGTGDGDLRQWPIE